MNVPNKEAPTKHVDVMFFPATVPLCLAPMTVEAAPAVESVASTWPGGERKAKPKPKPKRLSAKQQAALPAKESKAEAKAVQAEAKAAAKKEKEKAKEKKAKAKAKKARTSDAEESMTEDEGDESDEGSEAQCDESDDFTDGERDEVVPKGKPRGLPTGRKVAATTAAKPAVINPARVAPKPKAASPTAAHSTAHKPTAVNIAAPPFPASPPSPVLSLPPSAPPSPEKEAAQLRVELPSKEADDGYVGKKRAAPRSGTVNREGHDGVNLRRFPEAISTFHTVRGEKSSIDCGTTVDIADECLSKHNILYFYVNQFKVTLSDGSTPHGWINSAYVELVE